jgi:zinc protease
MRRLREHPISDRELSTAVASLTARFAVSLEEPEELLTYALTRTTMRLPSAYWREYPSRLARVTAADVQRVARAYLDAETMQIVAVGDAEKLRAALSTYGAMDVYDVDGRLVTPR